MNNWKAIAQARGIPEPEIDRIMPPLEALEKVFRPLAQSLTPEMEPALLYRVEEEQA
jgi:hypothetical protein